MDIMEPVLYVRIPSGFALLRLVLSKLNNFNSLECSRSQPVPADEVSGKIQTLLPV